MPVYTECWWDSIIIDIFLSNIPGIIMARLVIKFLKVEDFDWFGRHNKNSIFEWEIWTK